MLLWSVGLSWSVPFFCSLCIQLYIQLASLCSLLSTEFYNSGGVPYSLFLNLWIYTKCSTEKFHITPHLSSLLVYQVLSFSRAWPANSHLPMYSSGNWWQLITCRHYKPVKKASKWRYLNLSRISHYNFNLKYIKNGVCVSKLIKGR